MNTVIIVCVIAFTIFACLALVYLIMTLLQVQRAVREVELILRHTDERIEKVAHMIDTLSALFDRSKSIFSLMSGSAFKTITAFIGFIKVANKVLKIFRVKKSSEGGKK
ncbi:hypothetical protein ACFL4A_01915 [bacterium]